MTAFTKNASMNSQRLRLNKSENDHSIIYKKKNSLMFIYLRERERERERGQSMSRGGTEKEGDTESEAGSRL